MIIRIDSGTNLSTEKETHTITLDDQLAKRWLSLPQSAQKILAEKSIKAVLEGQVFPSGIEKLELAIVLAEAGVKREEISFLTHLEAEVFEDFMK
ncbi:MAG: hypothetical protein SFU91_15160 [Chloroherpetonaceae bacterium]|nr:hypothetical protein [Chloroherpetonaceae bacterium]